jgi:hypothetical protein
MKKNQCRNYDASRALGHSRARKDLFFEEKQ